MSTTPGRKQAKGKTMATSDLATTILASVAIALPLMFYMRQHVEILRCAYEIESLEDRRADLLERSRELGALQLEAASLRRVEAEAPALGLVAPPMDHVLLATSGGAADVALGTAAGVTMTARLE